MKLFSSLLFSSLLVTLSSAVEDQNPAASSLRTHSNAQIGTKVYFQVKQDVDGAHPGLEGRIILGIYNADCPYTSTNFVAHCTCRYVEADAAYCYKDTIFHRVIDQFMIQGGDTAKKDGMGGKSIYGLRFEDENFLYQHDQQGLLSMANAGPNTNGSQFFITLGPTPWLNRHHVVFGRVIEGLDLVIAISKVPRNPADKPHKPVIIVDCGILDENHKKIDTPPLPKDAAITELASIKEQYQASRQQKEAVPPQQQAAVPQEEMFEEPEEL